MNKIFKYFSIQEKNKRKYHQINSYILKFNELSTEELHIRKIDLETNLLFKKNIFKVLFGSLLLVLAIPFITNLFNVIYKAFINYDKLLIHEQKNKIIIGLCLFIIILVVTICILIFSIYVTLKKQKEINKKIKVIELIINGRKNG